MSKLDTIIRFFVMQIDLGKITIEQVPATYKSKVAKYISEREADKTSEN
ncbi:CD1375 family protein [Vagococcus entomophilus]|nr:CD1375 family protein [Vagococcus entomophilus]